MISSRYGQVGAMLTVSHEVVNRVAMTREEDTQAAYHVAKRNYQLTLNRISSCLPPAPATIKSLAQTLDKNDLSSYCSSTSPSLSATRREKEGRDDELDCTEIDELLYARALKRQEEDAKGGPLWKRDNQQPLDTFLRREALARSDIEEVEYDFYRRITGALRSHPSIWTVEITDAERRARKEIEDAWMSASLPFLENCSIKQVEFIEELWRRAFGKNRPPRRAQLAKEEEEEALALDVRLCHPLLQRCETIRRETESEEEIAYLYLRLGEAAQRDLVARGVMRCNPGTGLLDSVSHPISALHYDEVDFAFGAEFRYLQSLEETQRMEIIDASLAAMDELCTAMMAT
ncbi:hypothetical protein C3747_108g78 [Trypanosoma cruzi]|uniref:Uncharacterized protein n=2 Tax=Trypanosoma cruzi TaxID=5693 RepID=Q4CP77_TRYCC|nr:hypothetical protein, conserved [Trypanosoma cruzi]EAN82079.1 hypothetical protein, conserved [Trypanosoma cruzi]PWV06938.1 hypothetical protein C3747_108g78 [Trypanosoma cruzi]RNC44603.1 hypothetical protein TcCL_NonESM05710 [Trypanosoma cruzi]|eukprot:XP_803930.1 hypothetical protein [Trypanosoma cruzi strain CL Brener]